MLLLLVAGGVLYLVASSPLFLGLRQDLMGRVLSDLLRRPATVNGDVRLTFTGPVGVVLKDIQLQPLADRKSLLANQFVESMEFQVPVSLIVGAGGSVSRFQVSGARIDLGDISRQAPDQPAQRSSPGASIRNFLTNPLSRDLRISDVVLRYRNDRDGWDEELVFNLVRSEKSGDGRHLEIDVDALINRTPLTVSGRIQDPDVSDTVHDLAFSARLETGGLVSIVDGGLDISNSVPKIDAETKMLSDSIGDLLDSLGVARTLEGVFEMEASLHGPIDALSIMDLRGSAETADTGDTLKVAGAVQNIALGTGIELAFSVDFAGDAAGTNDGVLSPIDDDLRDSGVIPIPVDRPSIDDDLRDSGAIPVPMERPADGMAGQPNGLPPIENELRDTGEIPLPVGRPVPAAAGDPSALPAIDEDLRDTGMVPIPTSRPIARAGASPMASGKRILDLHMTGYSGRLVGDLSALSLEDAIVRTNFASPEIKEIGPISVGRIVKGEDDRVGLRGLRIQDGPSARPTLVLAGDIDDLLAMSGVLLEGQVDLPLDRAHPTQASPEKPAFGRLRGTVAIADTDGTLGLKDFSGWLEDSDVLDMTLKLAVGEIRQMDDIVFTTDIRIPDLSVFSDAIGGDLRSEKSAHFAGDVSVGGGFLKANGEAAIGRTVVDAALQTGEIDAAAVLRGTIRSSLVRLSDVETAIRLFSLPDPERIGLDLDPEIEAEIERNFRADVRFDIDRIAGDRNDTGKADGRLTYGNRQVRISDLSLGYLGGIVTGTFTGDFGKKIPVYSADGSMGRWPMGRFLAAMGLSAPMTGILNISIKAQASGKTASMLLNTLTGHVTVSLWDGTVPGRLLDLTGLNLVSWLFSKQSDDSKIVCTVVPLRFRNGRANGNTMILETDSVQIVGGGWIDFPESAFEMSFVPRPKRQQAVNIVSPFTVYGAFADPRVRLEEGRGARVVAEVVALPVNLIGQIFTGGRPIDPDQKPCVVQKSAGPR